MFLLCCTGKKILKNNEHNKICFDPSLVAVHRKTVSPGQSPGPEAVHAEKRDQ